MIRGVNVLLAFCGFTAMGFLPSTQAGTSTVPAPATANEKSLEGEHFYENHKEVSLASGALFSLGGDNGYTIAPILASYHWQLDDVGLEGWRRGNTEFIFTGYWDQVVHGPENHFVGALFGPRYNFVQPDWKLVPYIEARVGFGFTDSTAVPAGAQGQDFCFTFAVSSGARYFITDQFSVSAAFWYQHWSNGGLSEPARNNNGLDTAGPVLSLNYAF